jgi:hypothetical protein
MGYMSCPADSDLWFKEQTDRKGRKYYSNILWCIDNLLAVHHNTKHAMGKINSFLPLKPDSASLPEMYLRAKLKSKAFNERTSA